jgi:hypothetical protein
MTFKRLPALDHDLDQERRVAVVIFRVRFRVRFRSGEMLNPATLCFDESLVYCLYNCYVNLTAKASASVC